MYLYSGNCRQGVCGTPTRFIDVQGKSLFVGDIVIVYSDSYTPDHLTAVVDESFISYSDGTHVLTGKSDSAFIMGIKSSCESEENEWNVLKVKDWSDAIEGEKWTAFGFNYSNN